MTESFLILCAVAVELNTQCHNGISTQQNLWLKRKHRDMEMGVCVIG